MKRRRVPNPLPLALPARLLRRPMQPDEPGRRPQQSGKDRTVYKITNEGRYALVVRVAESTFVTDLIQSLTTPGYVKSWQATMGSRT